MSLTEDLQNYKQSELKRLSSELNFMDKIKNNIDDVLDPIAKDLYDAVSPILDQKTTLPEDHDVAKSMIQTALEKSVDPSVQTTISDSVNRNLGDTVGLTLGDQTVANMISAVANLASAPDVTGLTTVPLGGFASATEVPSDIYDTSRKMQQKVLNAVAVAMTNNPGVIPEFAMTSINNFVEAGNSLSDALTRHTSLVASIQANTAALDITYYSTDVFARAQNAKTYLQSADNELLLVRRDVISTPSVFHKDFYDHIRDVDILAAAQALVDYGSSGNMVVEIRGALAALDYLMIEIVRLYGDFYRRLECLVDFFGKFSTNMKFHGTMFAHVNQIQAEVRSIIRSIDAAVEAAKPSNMSNMERLWYFELLAMYQKMYLSTVNITDYFDSDPDGYIADYIPVSTRLENDFEGFAADLSQLQSLTAQFKYWVQRRLSDTWPNTPIIQTKINALSTAMQNITTTNVSEISTTSGHATAYDVPIGETPYAIKSMLEATGMDRASLLLSNGQWGDFFNLTPDNVSMAGCLIASLNTEMASVISPSGTGGSAPTTFNSLEALSNAQNKIQDQKRATDLLSSTLARFKADGQKDVVDAINDVNNTCAAVEKIQGVAP